MQAETIDRIFGRLYGSFILRDLTFLVSGAITLGVAVTRPVDLLASAISSLLDTQWMGVVAYLALSYVLGVLLQEAARVPLEPLSDRYVEGKRPGRTWKRMQITMMEYLLQRGIREHTFQGLERLVFLRQVAATQNATFAALLVIAAVRFGLCAAILAAILLIPGMLLTARVYCDKSLQLSDNYHELILLP